jgi:sugar O-acyltransferase (sialic acid O-acetyltransferase NeuD family)
MGTDEAICLFGAGGHGRGVAAQIARLTDKVAVFADDGVAVGTALAGTVVSFAALEDIFDHALIVTIGNTVARRAVQTKAQNAGVPLTWFIADPRSYFSPPPGPGTVVLSGAVVNAETVVGAGVIINNGAVVEHGCHIGDFTHVSPGAVIAGDVRIGADCWIGANATVLQGVQICDHVTIGAGAVVNINIEAAGTYVGIPARRILDKVVGFDKQRIK